MFSGHWLASLYFRLKNSFQHFFKAGLVMMTSLHFVCLGKSLAFFSEQFCQIRYSWLAGFFFLSSCWIYHLTFSWPTKFQLSIPLTALLGLPCRLYFSFFLLLLIIPFCLLFLIVIIMWVGEDLFKWFCLVFYELHEIGYKNLSLYLGNSQILSLFF